MRSSKFVLTGFACLLTFAAAAPVAAQQGEAAIYEPLVDRDARGFKEKKYEKDLTFCRNRAAPQENAARAGAAEAAAGAQQATAGAALATAGNIARYVPVPGLGAANGLWAGGGAAEAAGAAIGSQGAAASAQAAAGADMAASDYRLVVDRCLQRRGYVLLR
ncbi:hypothetical protein [Methylocystis sp. ATCC 49242]|uniref:hypothetical protein n=1 Tax=Methylocystis sp. ATCC 49242 TaxID=622637 RepID=UPI0001F86F61|nr:hypothetical protein [Methylocystis sp. ATCC 49242]